MSLVRVFVLNLPASVQRRAAIATALAGMGVGCQFIEAIDGKTAPAPPTPGWLFDRPMTPGEFGCAASHLAALRIIAGGPDEFACVLEDDAELRPGFSAALDAPALSSLPAFDVLRLVSDAARARFPAWPVGTLAGAGVFAMARPGFCTQAQIWSRAGARKVVRRINAVRAPIDFALYHDCHVLGLRVLELRPGVVAHDRQFEDAALTALSDIGERPTETPRTARRRLIKWHRKGRAALSFALAWGAPGVGRLVLAGRPGVYFR